MDYIKNYFTFKGIVSTTAIAVATCGLIAATTVGNMDSASQNMSKITEESSADDGSAPGQSLIVNDSNTQLIQSATLSYPSYESINEQETEHCDNIKETFLAATNTEETISEASTENTTTEIVERETETVQPSASAQGIKSQTVADSEYVINFTNEDYQVLCTIVEAEAGDQDAQGRILVANVIINRVKSGSFPNSIKEVVFQNNGKTYQFSPTKPGGRYYRVTASELTIECVDRALRGEDYSQGAMYFAMKTSSNSWFNRSLNFLFKHGDHYFYK